MGELARSASALTINLTFDPDPNYTAAGVTDIAAMKAACTYAANSPAGIAILST
jgi:hypothetical protein